MDMSQIRWYFRWGVDTIRYEGLHILLWRMLKLGVSPFGRLDMDSFCRKDLTQPLGEIPAKVDLTIGQATEADIDQLAALVAKRYGPKQKREMFKTCSIQETIRERFQQGAKCFVGKIGTEMVAYNWIFFHRSEWPHGYLVISISLNDDEALCEDAFTAEEWRGKRIHGAIHNQMLLYLQRSGIRRAYTLVGTDNVSSSKALHRLGWEFYGIALTFISHRTHRVRVWRVRGTPEPFVTDEVREPGQYSST
jgi:hypothetical protein